MYWPYNLNQKMGLAVRLFGFIESIICYIVAPYFWLISMRPKQVISAAKNPILGLSAVVISEKIRKKELTSEAVVLAYIERIKEVNPQLNAVVEDRFEAAIEEARACDEKLAAGEVTAKQLEVDQPLFGVPITVKESCGVKGLSQTVGAVARAGMKADSDGEAVRSVKTAGAIPLCVTNLPELSMGLETYNNLFGTTNNPYDTRRTPGGSSGGEAALIASSASLIGIGTDLAGSVRVPAHFAGIFGHKPTPGLISMKGHVPLNDDPDFNRYLVIGPLARYAEDLELALRVITTENRGSLHLDVPVDVKTLRVLYMEEVHKSFGLVPVNENIKRVIRNAAEYLGTEGADVAKTDIEGLNDALDLGLAALFSIKAMPRILLNANDPKHEDNSIIELGKLVLGLSCHTSAAIFFKLLKDTDGLVPRSKFPWYREKAKELEQTFKDLLSNDGVFLLPTHVNSAPFHGELSLQHAGNLYTMIFNVLGLPATHVPMGLDDEGLPIGLQVVAAPMQDRLCLAVAKELEKGFGGWKTPARA